MDNEKIGKFITKLRKAKNLTQQQLGDLVGVGGKSVSKWERGLNMPDISIINQVSKVLGITSDELLKGEFSKNSINEEYRKKRNQRRYRLFLVLLLILTVAITTLLVFKFRNVTHKYWITSKNENFYVEGSIEYDKKSYSLNISKIYCRLDECKNYSVDNLIYNLTINDVLIYKNNLENLEYKIVNEHLNDKIIYVTDYYVDSIITYNQMKDNNINIVMNIEINSSNGELLYYIINLKIADKEA